VAGAAAQAVALVVCSHVKVRTGDCLALKTRRMSSSAAILDLHEGESERSHHNVSRFEMLGLVEAGEVFRCNPVYISQKGKVVAPHVTTDALSAVITARLEMRGATNLELPRFHALNQEYRSLY